ncbi:hypothetical protein LCGC14_0858430 [marine sediment metagenome]|uniref:Uncharacterized protein n=1 Tax=marine sediment metagenome TaxID=412755 RepID=A0A0F9RSQ8_9ZZZZ
MGEPSSMADDIPMPSDEELKAIHQQQQAKAEAMQAVLKQAAEDLPKRMKENSDLTTMGYMMLFGYRLIQWAAAEASTVEGMTPAMLHLLAEAQEMKSREAFNFSEVIKDFQDKQMGWLESKRREELVRLRKRERRIHELVQKLRRKDIPLPFHSLTALFGEDGFRHGDLLLVFGPAAALELVLRRCALEYQKSGGIVALLSTESGDEGDERIAKITLPPTRWRGIGEVYSDVLLIMEPIAKAGFKKPVGLVVVEGLDNTCLHSPMQEGRPVRLFRALMLLKQYQQNHGIAMIVGVATDDDPQGIDLGQLYAPPLLQEAHVRVAIQESKIVDGVTTIVIGNDIVVMDRLREELEGGTTE